MSTPLFELVEENPKAPEVGIEAAAAFYDSIAENAAKKGMTDLAKRLRAMAAIDKDMLATAQEDGTATIFLNPDAYPIDGDAPSIVQQIKGLRQFLIDPTPSRQDYASKAPYGSEQDANSEALVNELEQLLVAPEHMEGRFGYIDDATTNCPNGISVTWISPTVIDGIWIQRREHTYNRNEGRQGLIDGEWRELPREEYRKFEITIYRPETLSRFPASR